MVLPVRPPSLAVLGERHGLDDRQLDQLDAVLGGLAKDEHAPTTVRDPEQAVDVHLADSLVGLEVDRLRSARRLADIGAGAGFPGLPLAVALPASEMRLVESQSKKCQFLRRAIAAAGVDNVRVAERRAEEWSEGLGAHDAVIARALAPAPVVLEYAAPLLEHGGVLVDWRGRRDSAREAEAACAAEQLGMRLLEIRRTEPYEGARDHHLHVFEKVAETPSRFPRRAGVARKRPIGC
jgi:16S rRNA (guanine527-N7)-methyltransferase